MAGRKTAAEIRREKLAAYWKDRKAREAREAAEAQAKAREEQDFKEAQERQRRAAEREKAEAAEEKRIADARARHLEKIKRINEVPTTFLKEDDPGPPPPPGPWGEGGSADTGVDWASLFGGDMDEFANIPDAFKLYKIDGRLFMVWDVPIRVDESGNVIDTLPIAYNVTEEQLKDAKGQTSSEYGFTEISQADWNGAGGIVVGDFTELNNPDENPLEFFFRQIEEQSVLFPWLLDPEVMALAAAAHLEGRSLDEAELAGTQWWQNHNADERQWLVLNSSDPLTAQRLIEDNRIAVDDLLRASGISNAGDITLTIGGTEVPLAHWLADMRTKGSWSDTYLNNQITVLSDPSREDEIDSALAGLMLDLDVALDTNTGRTTRVRDLYNTWLGPLLGTPSDDAVEEWASRLRSSPDGEDDLIESLKDQRLALLPEYQDRQASYQSLAGPWRNMMAQAWGGTPDETDPFFLEMVRSNDAIAVGQMLRQEGLNRGNDTVASQALNDMFDSLGGAVVRQA